MWEQNGGEAGGSLDGYWCSVPFRASPCLLQSTFSRPTKGLPCIHQESGTEPVPGFIYGGVSGKSDEAWSQPRTPCFELLGTRPPLETSLSPRDVLPPAQLDRPAAVKAGRIPVGHCPQLILLLHPPPSILFKETRLHPQPTELPRRLTGQLYMLPAGTPRFLGGQSSLSKICSFSTRQKANSPSIWCLVDPKERGRGKDVIFTMGGKNSLTIPEARIQLSTHSRQEVPLGASSRPGKRHMQSPQVRACDGVRGVTFLWTPGSTGDEA